MSKTREVDKASFGVFYGEPDGKIVEVGLTKEQRAVFNALIASFSAKQPLSIRPFPEGIKLKKAK